MMQETADKQVVLEGEEEAQEKEEEEEQKPQQETVQEMNTDCVCLQTCIKMMLLMFQSPPSTHHFCLHMDKEYGEEVQDGVDA